MTYQEKKEQDRQTAIQWQNEFAKGLTISWGVFAITQNYFEKLERVMDLFENLGKTE